MNGAKNKKNIIEIKRINKAQNKSNTNSAMSLLVLGFGIIIVGLIVLGIVLYSKVPKITNEEQFENIYAGFKSSCGKTSLADSGPECFADAGQRDYIKALANSGLSGKDMIAEAIKKFGLYSLTSEQVFNMFYEDFQKNPPENRPIINVTPDKIDLYIVNQSSTSYVISEVVVQNTGNASLIISDVDTSCSCLSAVFIQNTKEHPRFSRFSESFGWSMTLEPNEKVTMRIYFDPRINDWERGFQNRWVYIYSNDPLTPNKLINIQYDHEN